MGAPVISRSCRGRHCLPYAGDLRIMLALAALALALTAATALACRSAGPAAGGPEFAMTINRIAYIDEEGQLGTVNPDGSQRRRLTAGVVADAVGRMGGITAQPLAVERAYSWPAWSPDGARIAVSMVQGGESGPPEVSVQSVESATGVGGPVFVNDDPLPIAEGTPHYVQWSPDGRRLGITAATREGLTLYVADGNPADGSRVPAMPAAALRGAPLYFNWSPDSRSLAAHSGEEVLVVHFDAALTPSRVQEIGRSRSFRAPAWSPDGAQLAWSGPGGDSEALWLSRPFQADYPPLRLAEVDGDCAFLWSPDGAVIAVADRQNDGSPAYRRLRLVSADGGVERVIQEDDRTLAFFWEPGGGRLAWVALNPEERAMEWRIDGGGIDGDGDGYGDGERDGDGAGNGDGDGDRDRPVGGLRFSPTGSAFLMLAFFDQYAGSHSLWAPDGSGLVAAGDQHYLAQRRNGSSGGGPRVFVAGVNDGGLRDVVGGSLAVWSPR